MDAIQIVCEECFFLDLANYEPATEANAAGMVANLLQKAKRMILNMFQKALTIIRNIRNRFRKQKVVYMTEPCISAVKKAVSAVHKSTQMVDGLTSVLGVSLMRDYSQLSDRTDNARKVHNEIDNITDDLNLEFSNKVRDERVQFIKDKPLSGKIVAYTDYDRDVKYLSQVEERMTKMVEEIKKAEADNNAANAAYPKVEWTVEEIRSRNFSKLYNQRQAIDRAASNAAGFRQNADANMSRFASYYFSAYGSAVTSLLKLVSLAQDIINECFKITSRAGVRSPADLKRNPKYDNPLHSSNDEYY